jgi:CTD small phosphatase-like protein 2
MPCDVVLKLRFNKPDPIKVGVNIRPYAQECLKELSEYYELVLFTASHEIYANAVADYLDPQRQFFSFRYFR